MMGAQEAEEHVREMLERHGVEVAQQALDDPSLPLSNSARTRLRQELGQERITRREVQHV